MNRLWTSLLALTVAAVALHATVTEPSNAASPRGVADGDLARLVPEMLRRHSVPGAALAIVRGGKVRVMSYGVARSGRDRPVTGSTVFEAASLSKPVFAYAVLKLADRGVLDLDEPLGCYLPVPSRERGDRPSSSSGRGSSAGQGCPPEPPSFPGRITSRLTARLVLTHQSGLPNRSRDEPLAFEFEPGQGWGYSGQAYVILQRAVEARLGEPLQQIVGRLVFRPLGMESSSFVWRRDYGSTAATPHDADGRPLSKWKPGPEDAARGGAAGSLHTTAHDMGRFMSALLSDRTMLVRMAAPRVQVRPELGISWGLGLAVEELEADLGAPGCGTGCRYFFHWGANPAFRSFLIGTVPAPPEARVTDSTGGGTERLGLVLLTNGERGLELADEVVEAITGREHPLFDFYLLHPTD